MFVALRTQQSAGKAQPETHIFDKTRICKFYEKGRCKRGSSCTFAHSESELRAQPDFFKTQLCTDYFRSGVCPNGGACRYAHSPDEVRHANLPKRLSAEGRVAPAQPSRMSMELAQAQAQLDALQAQLRALQVRPGVAALPAPKVEEHQVDCDFTACAKGFSRQSTQEPADSSGMETDDDAESWFGDLEPPTHACEDEDEAVECELLVKNSFFCLQPIAASTRRRATSAPPSRG